jgi:hypothetical protein
MKHRQRKKNDNKIYVYTSKENRAYIVQLAKEYNFSLSGALDCLINTAREKKYELKIDVGN